MAYVTPRPGGRWEVREALATAAGPRSRTLASFRELDREAIETALARSSDPSLEAERLREAARRAGAPVQPPRADRAVAELLAELDAGRRPRRRLERLLRGALGVGGERADEVGKPSAAARAAARWASASPQRRGETLRDLLLLADRLPAGRRAERPPYPRLASRSRERR